jgi:hypothetical protein
MRPPNRRIARAFIVVEAVTVSIFCELNTSVTFDTSDRACVILR